jgi:hypothetical protein
MPHNRRGVLRWADKYNRCQELQPETRDQVGQMLVDANTASVNDRYDENNVYVYSYSPPKHIQWQTVELLKAIDCFEYQSCETGDWVGSEAYNFCDSLRGRLIGTLPDYSDSAWGITADTEPVAFIRAMAKRSGS